MDLSMDGLMVESHYNPNVALSDAAQQVTPEALGALVSGLTFHPTSGNKPDSEGLIALRNELDQLDNQMVEILKQRFELTKDIAAIKEREGERIFQMDRWLKLVKMRMEAGQSEGMTPEFMHDLFSIIHKYSVEYQTTLIKKDS
jgi:chorismate mutase